MKRARAKDHRTTPTDAGPSSLSSRMSYMHVMDFSRIVALREPTVTLIRTSNFKALAPDLSMICRRPLNLVTVSSRETYGGAFWSWWG